MPEVLNYQPRGDRVLVLRKERPKHVEGEVIVPESHKKPLDEGIVVAFGPGRRHPISGAVNPIEDLDVGMEVLFVEYAGTEVKIDGVEYISMREEEIHGRRVK